MITSFRKLLAYLCALLCSCGGGGDETKKSVTLDGDSVLFGLGIDKKPAEVLREAGFDVVDKTAAGLTLRAMIAGYEKPSPDATPDDFPNGPQPPYSEVSRSTEYVVIEAGGNDILGLCHVSQFEADMRSAIEIVMAEGRTPVLTGIIQFGDHPFVTEEAIECRSICNAVTHALASEHSIPHARWDDEPIKTIDGIHPTQDASIKLSQRLIDAMR